MKDVHLLAPENEVAYHLDDELDSCWDIRFIPTHHILFKQIMTTISKDFLNPSNSAQFIIFFLEFSRFMADYNVAEYAEKVGNLKKQIKSRGPCGPATNLLNYLESNHLNYVEGLRQELARHEAYLASDKE